MKRLESSRMYLSFGLAIILTIVFFGIFSCQDDDGYTCDEIHAGEFQAKFDQASGHEKYQVIQDFFLSLHADSAYINQIDSSHLNVVAFHSDNGHSLCIPLFFIRGYSLHPAHFDVLIRLTNGQDISVPSFTRIETLSLDSIVVDPYDVNPLCALRSIAIPIALSVDLTIIGKQDQTASIHHRFNNFSTTHRIPILGLYGNYENKVAVKLISKHGSVFYSDTILILTSELSIFTSDISIIQSQPDKMKAGFNLVSTRNHPSYDLPFMFDRYGEIRWLLDFKNHPELNRLFYDTGIERLNNGNWYLGDIIKDKIYEIGLLGDIVNEWELGDFSFHHKVQEKSNGNFLVTVSRPGSMHANGRISVEDHIIEIDRKTGEILHVLDLKESLDEYRISIANTLNNNRVDWLHANALYSDESDQSIIFSSRYQGAIKVSLDNKIKWILGPHRGWTVDRNGQDLSQFLLQPLDAQSIPISNPNILEGSENHPDFEWNWGQHAVSKLNNGNIILYDNGYNRNFGIGGQYSRIVEYEVDDKNKTIRQIWSFGKAFGMKLYSSVGSNVDYDVATDNYFMNGGFVVPTTTGHGGKMLEIDRSTKEIVFEAELTANNSFTFHRMHRIQLYE